jgi:hypothetical protein
MQTHNVTTPRPAVRGVGPGARPLSHHEILELMGPFTRRDRHLDMRASRREERLLVLAPMEHPPPAPELPRLREVLSLEARETGWYRLVRELTALAPDGATVLRASLTAAGRNLEALAAGVEAVPLAQQFHLVEGICVQCSYRLETASGGRMYPVPTRARALVEGVTVEIDADRGGGTPFQLRLVPPAGRRLNVPEDLLRVLGRDWRPLREQAGHWNAGINLRSEGSGRAGEIEAKITRSVGHLARTLSRPPAEFHPRFLRERRRIAARQGIRMLVSLALVAALVSVTLSPLARGPGGMVLVHYGSIAILVGAFFLGDPPAIQPPRLPQTLDQTAWLVNDG